MMKWIPHIIRGALTLVMIFLAYKETGIWTAISLLALFVNSECAFAILRLRKNTEFINPRSMTGTKWAMPEKENADGVR